jgi:UDP-glucose 4-epimerase
MSKILIVGGAGFIGSHTNYELIENGFETIVFDNLSNGYREFVPASSVFYQGDLANPEQIERVFKEHTIDTVVHFAANIEVGESQIDPASYYQNNVIGTLNLLSIMRQYQVTSIVFSSTAAVYGNPVTVPIKENDPKLPINTYGRTKLITEQVMEDYHRAYGLNSIRLRYFNACGGDSQLRVGEAHVPETHLIPLILEAAAGDRESIKIFGNDYSTPDGTCIRDYVDVKDLASAHVLSVKKIIESKSQDKPVCEAINLGTKQGFSVKQIIDAVKQYTGKDFKVEITLRRPGDPDMLVADSAKAREFLGWNPEHSNLENIITQAWRWYPQGKELRRLHKS